MHPHFEFMSQVHLHITNTQKKSHINKIASVTKTRDYLILHALIQNRLLFQAICPGNLWARDNRWLLSWVQRLAGLAGGTGAFCPSWRHQPGQKEGGLLSRLVPPTGTKGPCPPLARLAVGPRTKATYCPGLKGCRDK